MNNPHSGCCWRVSARQLVDGPGGLEGTDSSCRHENQKPRPLALGPDAVQPGKHLEHRNDRVEEAAGTARAVGKSLRILKSETKAMKEDGAPPAATPEPAPAEPVSPRTIHAAPGDATSARPVSEGGTTTR